MTVSDINALAQMNRRNEAIGHAVGSLGLLAEVLAEEMVVWVSVFELYQGDEMILFSVPT